MTRLTLHHFVLAGLLGWGLPAILVVGLQALPLVLLTALPVWLAVPRHPRVPSAPPAQRGASAAIALVAGLYLVADASFGRQKLARNMFLTPDAAATAIAAANAGVSQGRGLSELIGTVAMFLPFALFERARRAPSPESSILRLLACLLVFYEAGISRGFVLVSVFAVMASAPYGPRRRTAVAALSAAGLFLLSSAVRGDFGAAVYSHPAIDAIVWPYINLELMLGSRCGESSWLAFITEFLKKFAPSFLFPKHIFSFNIMMSHCIYPHFGSEVASVSVFTYLGELFYYRPPLLTASATGLLLALMCSVAERLMSRHACASVRLATGCLAIIALRSRALDVLSLLLALVLFMLSWRACGVLARSLAQAHRPSIGSRSALRSTRFPSRREA